MALDPRGAALALHRFGFGPKAGSIAALAPDPLGALLADLDAPHAGRIASADLPSSGAENRAVFEANAEQRAKQKLEQKRKEAAQAMQTMASSGAENAMEQMAQDQKPDAPMEIRGELGSIRSSLPGCDVCELLPNVAHVMDKMTVVRSMTHRARA